MSHLSEKSDLSENIFSFIQSHAFLCEEEYFCLFLFEPPKWANINNIVVLFCIVLQ